MRTGNSLLSLVSLGKHSDHTPMVLWSTPGGLTSAASRLQPSRTHVRKTTHHSSSEPVSGWKPRDRHIIHMTELRTVAHQPFSAGRYLRPPQLRQKRTRDKTNLCICGIYGVRPARPYELRGEGACAGMKMLMQPEGDVTHRWSLSIQTCIIRCALITVQTVIFDSGV